MGCAQAILFTSQSHLWTSRRKKEREKSMFSTGLTQHLSGPKSEVSFGVLSRVLRTPRVQGSTNNTNSQSCAPKTTLGSTSCGFWAQTPCSALQTDLRPQKIPWLPTFPGSGTATEQVLGWGEHPGHCKAQQRGKVKPEGRGDWKRDGIVPNRARNSSGKTEHLEA